MKHRLQCVQIILINGKINGKKYTNPVHKTFLRSLIDCLCIDSRVVTTTDKQKRQIYNTTRQRFLNSQTLRGFRIETDTGMVPFSSGRGSYFDLGTLQHMYAKYFCHTIYRILLYIIFLRQLVLYKTQPVDCTLVDLRLHSRDITYQ